MKLSHARAAFAAVLLACPTFVATSFGQYTNGQAAVVVLGQPSFTSNVTANATLSTVQASGDVFVDNATGKVFVADTANNRVLRFSSTAALASGTSAEQVFGQPDGTSTASGTGPEDMNTPSSVYVDGSGNLWVADTGNNRVLRFASAATIFSQQPAADSSFGTTGTTDYQLSTPVALTGDASGNLYVVDQGNNRVLRFPSPQSASPIATGLFGQSNFSAGAAGNGTSGLSSPSDVALDDSGTLWVADAANNRVVAFDGAASASPGAAASVVLGQATFATVDPGTSSAAMSLPRGLAFDEGGRLYVSDSANNRVLIFDASVLATSGSAASFVLGQADFDTNTATPVSASSLNAPSGLSYSDQGFIWVADTSNNRVLKYAIIPGRPRISSSPARPEVETQSTEVFFVRIINSGSARDEFKLKYLPAKNLAGLGSLTFTFQGQNVTSQLKQGTFTTPGINASGGSVRLKVTARAKTGTGRLNFNIEATSATSPSTTVRQQLSVRIVRPK